MSKLKLSRKLQNMSESATIEMAQKARELKSKGKDVISLSLGEPDFDTPDYIKDAAKQALSEGYTKYTPVPGLIELREAISHKFKRDNNLDYSTKEIVVSTGAKQCIANVCLALLDEGDEVIIFTPYWVSYFEIVKFAGGTPKPLYAGIDQDYKVTASQLQAAISDKTKMIIFSSPSNPTGSVYTAEELEALSKVISNYKDLYVLADEIYEYINFTAKNPSIATFDGMKERTITINGMSKGFAMTGWRIGYMGAPAWIAAACGTVQGQFTSGTCAFSQKAAAIALAEDPAKQSYMKEKYIERKQLVKAGLDNIDGFRSNDPQGAFYFFPNVTGLFGKSNGKRIINSVNDIVDILLMEANVAVVTGEAFGDPSSLRISYAASNEILEEALKRMRDTLSQYR